MSEQLFSAIEAGEPDQVRELLAADASFASARDASGLSAVRAARYRGNTDIVDVLVAAGAELDVFDAATVGDTQRLGLLLDERPEVVDEVASDGFTPLQLAAFFGQPAAVELLLGRRATVTGASRNPMAVHALNAAAAGGHAGIVVLLLDAGADPDVRQHGGWTPLMSAAANGDDAAVTALLEHGADAGAKGDDGTDAAAIADQRGHPQLAERLRALTG